MKPTIWLDLTGDDRFPIEDSIDKLRDLSFKLGIGLNFKHGDICYIVTPYAGVVKAEGYHSGLLTEEQVKDLVDHI